MKVDAVCRACGAVFCAGVIERYGACCDALAGLLGQITSDASRADGEDDWYFTAPSRRSYLAQHVVFTAVMADAAMLDHALQRDVFRRDPAIDTRRASWGLGGIGHGMRGGAGASGAGGAGGGGGRGAAAA